MAPPACLLVGGEGRAILRQIGGQALRAKANGIEIEYETFGKKSDPALLLIMGLGAQLTLWPDDFCEGLAQRGFFVVRYDNRDVGLSTDFESWGKANLPRAMLMSAIGLKPGAPYKLDDMAADAVGLMEALGLARAHIVGVSMGGMIAQIVAGKYPQRTLSLVSVMSTTGRRSLPRGKPEALRVLLSRPEGKDRETLVQFGMNVRRVIGSPGYPMPEAEARRNVERNIDRRYYPQGVSRQFLAVLASGDRVKLLPTIRVPTLVLHGDDDPLVDPAGGRDTAQLIPGALLQTYTGWGHDVPPGMVPTLVDRIARHCASVAAKAA